MSKLQFWIRILAIISCLLITAQAGAKDKLENLNCIYPIEPSTPFYWPALGWELGYWDKAGLKLNFLASETTVPYVAFLKNGDADIAMLDGPAIFQAVQANIPISVIYELHPGAIDGIVVTEDSPIKSCVELVGKTVGLSSDRDKSILSISMELVGKSIDDVKVVVLGEGGPTLARAFTKKTVDAFAGSFIDWAAVKALGIKLRNISPKGFAETPANSFVVYTPRLKDLDDRLKNFLRVWVQLSYIADKWPDAVEKITRKHYPEDWQDEAFMRAFMEESISLAHPVGDKYGELHPENWERVQGQMIKAGELKKRIDPSTFLNGKYIDYANSFDKEEISKDMEKWSKGKK